MTNYGFKATDKNFKCRNYQFDYCNNQIDKSKTFCHYGKIKLCAPGFHFCLKLIDVNNYYPFKHNNRYFIVKFFSKMRVMLEDVKFYMIF